MQRICWRDYSGLLKAILLLFYEIKSNIRNKVFGDKNWHHAEFELEGGFDFGSTPKILREDITEFCFERMCKVVFSVGNWGKSKCVCRDPPKNVNKPNKLYIRLQPDVKPYITLTCRYN